MLKRGKPGMTPQQVQAFVDRFMPAYRAYLPRLYRDGPQGLTDIDSSNSSSSTQKPLLRVQLDKKRKPIPLVNSDSDVT